MLYVRLKSDEKRLLRGSGEYCFLRVDRTKGAEKDVDFFGGKDMLTAISMKTVCGI